MITRKLVYKATDTDKLRSSFKVPNEAHAQPTTPEKVNKLPKASAQKQALYSF